MINNFINNFEKNKEKIQTKNNIYIKDRFLGNLIKELKYTALSFDYNSMKKNDNTENSKKIKELVAQITDSLVMADNKQTNEKIWRENNDD